MKDFLIKDMDAGYYQQTIISGLDLAIPMGQITTIIGPNGCGKSTLLKAMGRIIGVSGGSICLNGREIQDYSCRELARRLSILPQSPTAPEGLTVEELVSYGRYPHQKGLGKLKEEDRKVVAWALEITGLGGLSRQSVDHLSGGQRQRVWIALALAQEAEVILLDEPTTYLDMAYQLEVLELLEELNRKHGTTIIMVLHDLNLASKYADYLIAMRDGKIVCQGKPEEVIRNDVLKEVYRIDAQIIQEPSSGKPICISYRLMNERKKEEKDKEKVAS